MVVFRALRPDVYPLMAALGTGVGVAIYSGVHCLISSPEVLVNKTARNDQLAESDWFVRKSDVYHRSLFRWLAESSRGTSVFPNDAIAAAK